MKDSIIEYKVKIFISSKCGGRYTVVRKALKMLLSESNIASVYTFETAGASSQDVVSSYINTLDDSDLCIFLIDNEDGIPDPVLSEHKRARELKKKCMYLFCDESKKEPTQLQMEIRNDLGERYAIVHEFSDFIEQGYKASIQDIINIYRIYCRGKLINNKETEEMEPVAQMVDTYKLDKHKFKGFELTKNELVKLIFPFADEIKETSELDDLSRQLLMRVIGKEEIKAFNFEILKKRLCDYHEDFLREFVAARVNALSAYFNNDLETCVSELDNAHNIAIQNMQIPNWLLNDVLIDMRNIQRLIDETKNQFSIENKGQKLLKENSESAYYPLLDRIVADINEDVLKEYLGANIDSPYTTSFGGLDNALKQIASAFVISLVYGSLTHILITRERMIKVLSSFCFIYRDHDVYVELLKALLMCQKDGELEKIIRAYNHTTDMINESDLDYLLNGINTIPIPHKKMISKFMLLKYFGYYFSDDKYVNITNELIDYIERWIDNDRRIFVLSTHIFKTLKSNIQRLNKNKILSVCISLFEKGLRRWYDDVLQIIEKVDFTNVSEEMEERTINLLVSIVSDKETRKNCHHISETIIHIRKNAKKGLALIDDSVKEHMIDFFEGNYSLEIFEKDKNDALKHIERFVKDICQQNEEQGKDGTYKGYMGNPYLTIRNIIEYDNIHLYWVDIEPIISAINSTLLAPKQSIRAKVNAIQLMMYLKNKSWADKELSKSFEKWMDIQNEVLCGYEDGLFDKDSLSSLRFNFTLLKVCFEKYDINELVLSFSSISQGSVYEIIKSLESIYMMLYNIDMKKVDNSILIAISQYVIIMSFHKEKDARYYSTKILMLLCRSNLKPLVLSQLSKMMDNDIYEIKACILNGINKVSSGEEEIVKYIKQKGKVDNHFLVREISDVVSEESN